MNCGAYMAEIIRAGIQTVDQRTDGGESEASDFPMQKAMRLVILPQAIRTMVPSPSSTSSSSH